MTPRLRIGTGVAALASVDQPIHDRIRNFDRSTRDIEGEYSLRRASTHVECTLKVHLSPVLISKRNLYYGPVVELT
ncbi:hypothetical protein Pla22_32480 [Rubripirellula amarantea]|uniref:Uncharacterized protein n=1 Tax=Rubripirellula amarantea TaxID=2527999 RepID=A0A5C5WK77_9BACT|nr:hypothetical protein [Rubripirellula amarantea]TWT50505.1 hypothetical protein Pla22_32480 [Rubripirellula amarantea]